MVRGRGRPAKPLAEHLEAGTFRPDRHGHLLAGDRTAGVPVKPADLTGPESAAWDAMAASLGGALAGRDSALLAEAARWAVRCDQLAGALAGLPVTDPRHGAVLASAATATDRLLALSQRFGLTPGDRAAAHMRLVALLADRRGRPTGKQPDITQGDGHE